MAQTLREALVSAVPAVMNSAKATQIGTSYESNFGEGSLDSTYLVPGTVTLADGVLGFEEVAAERAVVSWRVGDVNGWSKVFADSVPA